MRLSDPWATQVAQAYARAVSLYSKGGTIEEPEEGLFEFYLRETDGIAQCFFCPLLSINAGHSHVDLHSVEEVSAHLDEHRWRGHDVPDMYIEEGDD
jgi:hypothetical protein